MAKFVKDMTELDVQCPKCGAAVGEPCTGDKHWWHRKSAYEHAGRTVALRILLREGMREQVEAAALSASVDVPTFVEQALDEHMARVDAA